MSVIETFEHVDFTVEIYSDDDSGNPRTDYDNLGTIYMEHGGRSIQPEGNAPDGIVFNYAAYDDGEYPEDVEGKIAAHRRIKSVVLPVQYAYEGGVDECDEDDAEGYIYVTRERVLEEYSSKILTKHLRERVETYLRGEIETYNQWATGDVYGYEITDANGDDVESCWGLFGLDYCIEEAKRAAEHERTWREKQRAERLQAHGHIQTTTAAFWLPAFA